MLIRRKHDPFAVLGFAGGVVDDKKILKQAARREFAGNGLESVALEQCTPSETGPRPAWSHHYRGLRPSRPKQLKPQALTCGGVPGIS